MPRLTKSSPKYRKHSSQDCGFVCIEGRRVYFRGKYGSAESLREYHKTLAEWKGRNRPAMPAAAGDDLPIYQLIARYWEFAEKHYRKNGVVTKEVDNIRHAMRPLKRLYENTKVSEFGPLKLKTLQVAMIEDGLSRGVVNSRINRIRRVFRWAVSEQLAPPSLCHALDAVSGLQRGRTEAREAPGVKPVSDAIVKATLSHLSKVVAAMVRFQRLTGCRPSEVCVMRPCDIDRSGAVWTYRPSSHKSEHHNKERVIAIGPKAKRILMPYLFRDSAAYCFSPKEAVAQRRKEMRANRKSKVQPSQLNRAKSDAKRTPGKRYSRMSYLWAVRRACSVAFPEPEGLSEAESSSWRQLNWWSPNRLRHTAATEIRAKFGAEAARVTLGHSKLDTTEIYAEQNLELATKVAKAVG